MIIDEAIQDIDADRPRAPAPGSFIAAAFRDHMRAADRIFVDRHKIVGASDVGRCARQIFFLKREVDPAYGITRDAGYVESRGPAFRGTLLENQLFAPALRRRFGRRLLYTGKRQKTFTLGNLSATPDGLITGIPRDTLAHLGIADIGASALLVECKSIDPRSKLEEPKSEHFFQCQVQLGIVRAVTRHKPNFGLIAYIDAADPSKVTEFPVAFNPQIFAEAQTRADRTMAAKSAAELSPEGFLSGCRECDFCPFTQACGLRQSPRAKPPA